MTPAYVRNATLALLLLCAFGITGCDSCSPAEIETPQTIASPEPEPEPEPPADPLKEAREAAEKDAESGAVAVTDLARIVAADVEALNNQPKRPVANRPKTEPETGQIDVREVKRIFGMSDIAMRKCYERQLKGNPGLEGKVNLEVLIQGDGTVGSAKARPGSLNNAAVFDCMERQAKTLKFPSPNGGSVRVNNPYTFSPDF